MFSAVKTEKDRKIASYARSIQAFVDLHCGSQTAPDLVSTAIFYSIVKLIWSLVQQ